VPRSDLSRVSWRKSSYSGSNTDCVEVAASGPWVGVRDSKNVGPTVSVPAPQWASLLATVRSR
jgi:hypothetical protein